jgi:N-acetylmuramic acid 6-phosphate etherase
LKKTARQLARTEQRHPRSRGLDQKPTLEILRLINREDAAVAAAVRRQLRPIARAAELIVTRLRRGGRLIYVGAGTSGRLGVLDASECPPTFGISPRVVAGVIAGGRRALVRAVEGAEDEAAQGARDLAARKISARDVVVGLSASGSTLYVLGALRYARQCGAATIGIACVRRSQLARAAQICIAVDTGPEVLAGSTRMKAGTAQKMVLNMLSTAAMVRLGHVFDNWMINVALTNRKLRRRAVRILEEAAGVSAAEAARALRQAGRAARPRRHALRVALVSLRRGISAAEAQRLLARADGDLRRALEG